jgi:phage regulator Rha-like protein
MYIFSVINQNGEQYIDSREIAVFLDIKNTALIRSIENYSCYIMRETECKMPIENFFLKHQFEDEQGETDCCLVTKMGCCLIAAKTKGMKGIKFALAFVHAFGEMENYIKSINQVILNPNLDDVKNAARTIITVLQGAGMSPEEVTKGLVRIFEPMGLPFAPDKSLGHYSLTDIAKETGIYSSSGKPHTRAISAIISKLSIEDENKMIIPIRRGDFVGAITMYDEFVCDSVFKWLADNRWPAAVSHGDKLYRIDYGSSDNDYLDSVTEITDIVIGRD